MVKSAYPYPYYPLNLEEKQMRNVVILSFDNVQGSVLAEKEIRNKNETPGTILEAQDQFGLVRLSEAETFTSFYSEIQNLPPTAKKTFFVGVDEDGGCEILHNQGAVRSWLSGQE
jgi:hypothetical protein